jgi:dTDP-4-dehydrorhamnose reductase
MLEKKLSGVYHVVSRQYLSKYDFGVRVAQRFDLDAALITPASVVDGGLTAVRSPNLTLRTDKLTHALGAPPPDVDSGLERFYAQYQQGYAQRIRSMASG